METLQWMDQTNITQRPWTVWISVRLGPPDSMCLQKWHIRMNPELPMKNSGQKNIEPDPAESLDLIL